MTRPVQFSLVPFAVLPLLMVIGCSQDEENATPPREQVERFEYAVPMDDESPWPKFRRTPMQTGRSPRFLQARQGG